MVATFWRVRSGLPLPAISVGVALLTVGVLAGVAMSTGVVTVPGPAPVDGSAEEPEVAQLGGDQPPMEFTPVPSAVKVAPTPGGGSRVVVTPPPHSNPVVTPEGVEPRVSVVGTTVVPSVSLPAVSSEPLPSVGSSVVEEPSG